MAMHVAQDGSSESWEACGLPTVGEGGGPRAPFLGITPLCHSAAPRAQPLPSTSPHVPWAPAPSSSHAQPPLDEMVATAFRKDQGSSVTSIL